MVGWGFGVCGFGCFGLTACPLVLFVGGALVLVLRLDLVILGFKFVLLVMVWVPGLGD